MPDTTEKLEAFNAARKAYGDALYEFRNLPVNPTLKRFIGKYFRTGLGEVQLAVGTNGDKLQLLLADRICGPALRTEYWTWPLDGSHRQGFTEISREQYLAVARPLFAELAKMAGISEGKE